ncbi:hypothetical protein CF165_49460 [Amycolatopsis vastitatis]|uniref:Uncharacterized protein n=1 Tax=Amycolatopsis vastitatis TaxID=1905142 RepID=A0A229SJU0_9PSEU|nr:hypothetical protein CF165_49460 [Amycolatopsis vastitatis]
MPAHRRTDTYFGWGTAQGFYVGPGGCVQLFFFNGTDWQKAVRDNISNNVRYVLGNDPRQSFDRWALRNC